MERVVDCHVILIFVGSCAFFLWAIAQKMFSLLVGLFVRQGSAITAARVWQGEAGRGSNGGVKGGQELVKMCKNSGVLWSFKRVNTRRATFPPPPQRGAYIELLPGGFIVGYVPRVIFCHTCCHVALCMYMLLCVCDVTLCV